MPRLFTLPPDWKCRLPAPVRSFFFRTLEHPWETIWANSDYTQVQQQCPRCAATRHYRSVDSEGTVEWRDGPIPSGAMKERPPHWIEAGIGAR